MILRHFYLIMILSLPQPAHARNPASSDLSCSNIVRSQRARRAEILNKILNQLAESPGFQLSTESLSALGISSHQILSLYSGRKFSTSSIFLSRNRLIEALLRAAKRNLAPQPDLLKSIEESLQSQRDEISRQVRRRELRGIKRKRGEILNEPVVPEDADALRPVWRQEALRLILEWMKRPENQGTRPDRFDWSDDSKQVVTAIPVNYRRLVAQGSYGAGGKSHARRIYDNAYQAWLAIRAAAAEEGLAVPLRFLKLYGAPPPEFTQALQDECVQTAARHVARTNIPLTPTTVVNALGMDPNKLFYAKRHIFESPAVFFARVNEAAALKKP